MPRSTSILWLLLVTLVAACSKPDLPLDAPAVLVFSKTDEYRHANIESGVEALQDEAHDRGIRVVATEDAAVFEEDELAKYRAVVFFNTTGDVLDDAQQLAFERYVQAGGAFVGIHAAADTEWKENRWPWYTRLVGAAFASHPSTPSNVQEARLDVADASHPATEKLPGVWQRADEWYDYQRFNPNVKILLTVDEGTYEGGVTGDPHPIAWFHEFDGGRSFYTGLGHTEESFSEDLFLEHLFGGLRFAMGEGRGPPTLDYARVRPEDWRLVSEVLAEGIGEPIAMAFTPAGDLWVVERNGTIRRWDDEAGRLAPVASVEPYTQAENGLAGIVFDPGFEENGWVYLYWSAESQDAPTPFYRLARYDVRDGTIDFESEHVLLTVPIDYGPTSHEGGALQFDADGNLWLSTGDDTNPHGSDGHSPLDGREGRDIYDSRRSAADTQDLRGKILRIEPQNDGGYAIPEGNLFDDPAEGRPEIYAMGLRNPYRLYYDSKSGTLYWGEVGPDGRDDSKTRGPRGYDEFNRTREPGNFGWPFLIGPNLPYATYDFEVEEAGAFFEPDALRNDSPGNQGLRELPEARPAWMAYAYEQTPHEPFDLVGPGEEPSRTAMVGLLFRRDEYEETPETWPTYYDGKLVIYEFMRDWIRLVSMDDDGAVRKIEKLPIDVDLVAPIDVKMGPDGTLYVLEYGSVWFTRNTDSRLVRVSYFPGDNPLPVARASVDPALGAAPLEIALDGSGSFDRNPDDELVFRWVVHTAEGESEVASSDRATAVLEEPGEYEIELRVTDTGKGVSSVRVPVVVGNEPPEVALDLAGNQSFFFDGAPLAYAVRVHDTEDGSTTDGGIAAGDVKVQVAYHPEGRGDGTPWRESRAVLGTIDPAAEAIDQYGCLSCHQTDRDSAGPPFSAIAERYQGDPERVRALARKVIDGGGGAWGDRAMAAQPHVSDEKALQMVSYILLGPGGGDAAGLPLEGRIDFGRHAADSEEWEMLGTLVDGVYTVSATYTDTGGNDVGPITRRESRTLRAPRFPASMADRFEGAMLVAMPDHDSLPSVLAGSIPKMPEDFQMLVAQADGGYAVFEDIDFGGIDRVLVGGTAPSMVFGGGFLEFRTDAPDGPLIDTAEIESALVPDVAIVEADVSQLDGVHDLYLVFRRYDGSDDPPFLLAVIEFVRAEEVGVATP